jgi:outer membrane protein assembly factor BamB
MVRQVGRGGMAIVYLARQTDLDRDVALKELGAFFASDEAFAERFIRESRVAGSFSHPNIVTVYDFFQHDRVPYIAMEYVPRGSLRPLIGHLSLAQIAGVLEGLLAGLAQAAKRRIVHRDLKPENLMVTDEGAIKIADFGIAKALSEGTARLTATGAAIGTPAYMAPEQVTGTGVTPATDLYSTGVIAFELLAGRVPFDDPETMALLYRHVNEPPPDLKALRPEVSPELANWVRWLLAKNPNERPQSPAKAWDALEEIVIHLLGPRWRRDSRLLGDGEAADLSPVTPVPAEFPKPTPQGRGAVAETTPSPISPAVEAPPAPSPPTVRRDRPVEAPGAAAPRAAAPWRRRPVLLGAAAVVVLAVAGIAAALLVGGGGGGSKKQTTQTVVPESVPSPSERFAVAGASGTVVASAPGGKIVRLAGRTLRQQASFTDSAGPRALVGALGAVYVLDSETIFRLVTSSLAPLAAFSFPNPVAIAGGPFTTAAAVRRAAGGGELCEVGSSLPCAKLSFVPTGVGVAGTRSGADTFYVADGAAAGVVAYVHRGGKLVRSRAYRLGGATQPQGRLVTATNTVYVPVRRGVSVLDLKTGRARRITLPATPVSIARTAQGRLVAALYARNAVALIDPAKGTFSLVHPVKRPVSVAIDATGRNVYVAGATGALVAVNAQTGKAVSGSSTRISSQVVKPARISGPPTTARSGQTVTVRLPLQGGALYPGSIRIRDRAISDGRASFEILEGGLVIASSAHGPLTSKGLSIRVQSSAGGALVSLSATTGAFLNLSKPAVNGSAVEFTVTKSSVSPPPPPPASSPPPPPPPTTGITIG